MKMLRLFYALLFCFLFSCNNNTTVDVEEGIRGRVVSIADGDTFTLLTEDKKQVKVRLHGIDCPERAQDFGQVARQKLSDLVFNQQVRVVEKDIDRYKRTVGIAYTSDNRCVNEELLRAGLAWHYAQYDNNPEWAALEREAREQRIGLWSQRNPVRPSEYRKSKREPAQKLGE
jgi:endonuclease YncB( thermonuclease family)